MLDRFQVDGEGPRRLLNRWIGAMVQLFQPEIAVLLRDRDEAVMAWRWRRRSNVFEDPRLEITSSFAIDLDAQLAVVEGRGVEPGVQRGRTCAVIACRGWRRAGASERLTATGLLGRARRQPLPFEHSFSLASRLAFASA